MRYNATDDAINMKNETVNERETKRYVTERRNATLDNIINGQLGLNY